MNFASALTCNLECNIAQRWLQGNSAIERNSVTGAGSHGTGSLMLAKDDSALIQDEPGSANINQQNRRREIPDREFTPSLDRHGQHYSRKFGADHFNAT